MVHPPKHDFHLIVSPSGQAPGFSASLRDAATGVALGSDGIGPLDLRRLATVYLDPLRAGMGRGDSHDLQKRLGSELAAWLLPPGIRARLLGALVQDPGSVRLRLTLPTAPLANVPWEFLHLEDTPPFAAWNGFLSLHPHVSLVRQHADIVVSEAVPVTLLRVLVVCADPQCPAYPALPHLQREVTSVLAALRDSPECRSVEVKELTYATPAALRRELQRWSPNVLHFIGHGDSRLDEEVLVLESGVPGAAIEVCGKQLAAWLPKSTLRLVVLSACDTVGVARTLTEHVPAVVAMQMPWRDAVAGQFARVFYSALGTPSTIEEALQQARHGIQGAGADWGVPALYLAGADSVLFTRSTPAAEAPARTNLPTDERIFVGRRREIADLKRKIKGRGERLVTITGIGGMGKTRIARQVSTELLANFPDGVWLVECESLTSREDISAALCTVLELEPACRNSERALNRALASRRMLLLFDCFERVTQHANLIEEILGGAPGVFCLVTSRVVLNVGREYEYPLLPMSSTFEAGRPACDSVALFAKAAAHVVDGFKVNVTNRDTIGEICERLDGIPLRIVLTAGRLRYLSLEELRRQLLQCPANLLRLPGSGDRHTSMEQSIAESFLLLPIADQRLLWRLSLFVGGFHYEDAAEVCKVEPAVDVYEGIARLRNHSIVQAQVQAQRTRFKILDSVRTYLTIASQGTNLAANIFECQQRFAIHYAAFARRVQADRRYKQEQESTVSLWTEIGNLRTAIAYCIENRNDALVIDFADALGRTYFEAGYWSDFEGLADAAETASQRLVRPDVQARLLGLRGALAWRRGINTAAEDLFARRLALSEALGDMPACVDSLSDLAQMAHQSGRTELAKQRLAHAVRLADAQDPPLPSANVRVIQAEIALSEGDMPRAVEHAEQAKAALGVDADPDEILDVNLSLGRVYREAGNNAAAERALLDMLRNAIDSDRAFSISRALLELGQLYERWGNLIRAAQSYQAAERIHADLPSERRDLTREELARFKSRCKTPAVDSCLQKIRSITWRKIVFPLLSGQDA